MIDNESIPAKRILVIDDNASIHEDFRKILIKKQTLGDGFLDMESQLFGAESQTRIELSFEIDSAFQGREGFDMVQKAKSEDHPYALAFVDGRMPPGWDGIETIHHLWQECPDLQVVLCTAYADYSWQEICRVLGETDNLLILKKPFDNVEVIQMAHSLTRKWELGREIQYRIENLDDMVRSKTEEKDHLGALLKTALDHSPAGIIISDVKDVAIRWASPSASHILGNVHLLCPVNQKIIHDVDWQAFQADSTPYTPENLPLFRATVMGEIIQNEEFIIRNARGQEKWISSNAAPVRDSEGIISAGILIFEDITERKQAEVELKKLQTQMIHAERMESIGTLAGGIAHDFNNILFPVLGYADMLLEDIPENSPFRASVNGIYKSALRARSLVKQIITFSRQESNELELMKMQPVVKEALKLMRSTIPTAIDINPDINPDCGIIKADPTQIHQIVMNLTTNAYHAMEETGGELKVSLKEVELGEHGIISPDMTPGVYACLTVADTGKGMDKNLIDKIFDPFFTTKGPGKGTGMGLSVVHGIVKSINGTIQVYSESGKGTQFHVYLPVEKSLSEKQETNSKTKIQDGNEQILLVDDDEAILSMEKRMLERLGYQVISRNSSLEALEAFRANPDKFDLIITDMAMPNMSGDKLSVELTKIRPGIPILLCTGFSESISEEKTTFLGITGFLMKPVVMKDLAQKIREVLD